MDPLFAVLVVLIGAAVGFAAGLLGIGGGMILAPLLAMLLTWQQMPQELVVHAAIATAMATILFTSLSSVRAHHRRGNIVWPVVAGMTPGVIIGGLLVGGALFAVLKTAWLALFFSVFVAFNAYRMLTHKPVEGVSRSLPGWAGMFGVGAAIGGVSGLVGAGGGFLTVPFMARCSVPMHRAIGTSAAIGFPIALANCIGYIYSGWDVRTGYPGMIGFIYWPALVLFTCASVITAPMGARMTTRLPVATLKRVFACLLFTLAAYMGWQAIKAFG